MRVRLLLAVLALGVAAAADAASPVAVTGRYSATLGSLRPPSLDGAWTVQFTARGTYSLITNGAVVASGVYAVLATTLTVHDTSGPLHCTSIWAGRYRLTRASTTLRIAPISDQCGSRARILGHTFRKLP